MIVRLHNLSAHAPMMADALDVATLMRTCDHLESNIERVTEEDVRENWQSPLFDLCEDAWIIKNKCGQIVGYADVQHECTPSEISAYEFLMHIHVHPDYRGRGIGTLLLWLVEERTRQLMLHLPVQRRVTLQVRISCVNVQGRALLEREKYTLVRRFWRLLIDMEEVSTRSMAAALPGGQLKLDFMIAATSVHDHAAVLCEETYTAQQYEIYEKILRVGDPHVAEMDQGMQYMCK